MSSSTESDPRLVGLTTMRIERSADRRVVEVVPDTGRGNPLGTTFWDELPLVFPALADDRDRDLPQAGDPRSLQATKEGLNRCRDLTHEQGLEYVAAWNAPGVVRW